MSKTFLTNRLLLTAKHTCWMLHIIIFHSQFVVQYSNKCLASLPKCVNKCLALLSKIFFADFLQMLALHPRTYAFGTGPKCSSKCFALHPKYSKQKSLKPKMFGKKLNRSLVFASKVFEQTRWFVSKMMGQMACFCKCLPSHSDCLNKACCASKTFEQIPLLRIQDFWSNSLLFIQSVWTNALVRIQNVSK